MDVSQAAELQFFLLMACDILYLYNLGILHYCSSRWNSRLAFKKIKWMYQGFMLVFSWIWKDMHLRPLQLLGDNCHTNVVTLYICWWSHSCVCFILQCPYWLVSSAGRIKYRGVSAVSHSNRCALGICNAIWRSWMCLIDAKIFQPMTVPSS